jgi:glutathione S-transferase
VKLYGFPPSPNTWKVQAAAQHMNAPVPLELIDLSKGAQRSEDFLALNPCGRAPVLVDGDFTLWESNAIMQYLAAKARSSLWPDDVRTRADIMRWQSWQLAHWNPSVTPMIFENVVKPLVLKAGEPDAAVIARSHEALHKEAPILEKRLADHKYLVGETLTLADFSVAAPLFYAQPAKMPLERYPHIRRWFGEQAALPAWQETAPRM